MLFDLRGRGRRRTVQAIYLFLAILMGGGLVLFGIGSSSNGGIIDSIIGGGGGGSGGSATESIDKQIKSALAKTKANPKDADAYVELAIAQYKRAGLDGIGADGKYTEDGLKRLGLAASAYERHLALNPKRPNVRAARLMVNAYGLAGLNQLKKAVEAKQIVTAATDPPTSNAFAQLAQLAYQANETRVGDLAATRAVDLAESKDRKELRDALKLLKTTGSQGIPEPTTTATG